MIAKVKDLTGMIDTRVKLIESNKLASCTKEEILKVNTGIYELVKSGLAQIKKQSCDKNLIEKYTKIVESVVL